MPRTARSEVVEREGSERKQDKMVHTSSSRQLMFASSSPNPLSATGLQPGLNNPSGAPVDRHTINVKKTGVLSEENNLNKSVSEVSFFYEHGEDDEEDE